MINVGIIGCGKIAQVRHIPEYLDNKNCRLVGFYDKNPDRTKEIAQKYGGIAYASCEELLSNPTIDAVSVCVSNNLHAQITIEALRAGKHVLCEKPMATTLEDCKAMVKAAEDAGKKLLIGHNQRLAPAHRRAKKLVEEGLIGDIITFKTTFGHGGPETWSIDAGPDVWFFDKNTAVMGAMADLGIHKTDLIQFLTGKKIVETTAKLATLNKKTSDGKPISVDDNAFCIYKMENGIIGIMTASWTYYGPEDNSTILYGTKGIMRIYDDPQYAIKVLMHDGEKINFEMEGIQTNEKQTKSGVIDLFVDSILNDRDTELSGKAALSSMKAVFASIESSEKGKTITIDQD
ncbi:MULTISPECIES: Gfo/Idh/MocA family oxidoreductase [Tepidanaerobacter]|uniref:Gfo/Idh/MocA family protein n=1 Tax=Tepidanaerobacter TaxID=499228 RepID=UPI000AB26516|nr:MULTISPECIES: Gfo/Idh/MocA family oxidoreductase [Tepidanaerobacter]GLI51793.1 oxidoreductase [Tepidanaerobacter syntrophicus]HHV83899.1 Gfo/Idh/MocA family oxidoreductase [Tepidanaerobacter syntrophicus]